MRITFIRLFNGKKKNFREGQEVLMKHLRDEQVKNSESNMFNNIKIKTNNLINRFEQKNKNKKRLLKKNQVTLTIVALMLVTAGYMNYINNLKLEDVTDTADLGDAKLVSSNISNEENCIVENTKIETIEEMINNNKVEKTDINETYNNSIETAVSNEYFSKTKLERDTMYSQMLESYQKILENSNIENEQKNVAADEIKNINNRKNAISTIENLLKTKNMNESVVLINDNSINVIIKSKENLTEEQTAQIYNIVSRELNADIEDIHITTHI